MKQLLLVSIALFVSLGSIAQGKKASTKAIDTFLEKLEKGDEYGVVTVNKEMFKLFASMDVDNGEENLKELVKDINLLKVYILEEAAGIDDYNSLQSMAESSGMVELLSVKDGAERVKLYTKHSGESEIVEDILLLVRDVDQNVFIRLDGKINLRHLSKITKNMNIQGFDKFNLDQFNNENKY